MIRCCRFFFFCFFSAQMALSWVQPVSAQQEKLFPDWLEVSGWLDTMHSARITSPHDKVTSRGRLRLEARADFAWFYGFYSVDAEKNWVIADETGIKTQEFWLEHVADRWDVRMGRQIIIWGQADGVQITDVISPPDLTESITRDLDEIRMPVDGARLRILGDTITGELIVIPVFRAAVYPQGSDNPWAVAQGNLAGANMRFLPTEKPETSIENTEVAARISGYFSGLDVAASLFYTWDDAPALHIEMEKNSSVDGAALVLHPKHHRLTIFGLGFSRPWMDFVFRGEAALYRGQYLASTHGAMAKNLGKWLAGVDWTPGGNWTITTQLVGESIFDHDPELVKEADSFLVTLNISKKLMNERLTVANMLYFDCDNSSFYDRIKAEYEVADGFHLSVGLDVFRGDDGQFSAYEDNSQIWIKAKYNF